MGIELIGSTIAIIIGVSTILSKVGNVYYEIKETKQQLEFIHKDLQFMHDNDKQIDKRVQNIENFLSKTTDFELR